MLDADAAVLPERDAPEREATEDHPEDQPAVLWRRVGAYLATQPPALRGAAGLFRDLDDAGQFRAQTEAIAALMRLLAGHGGAITMAAPPSMLAANLPGPVPARV